MKTNESVALSTSKVLLVPYSRHHVPTYHEWMKDPNLQNATASEPLTLDEEYSMQESWREDHDKLTFIVCLPVDLSHTSPVARLKVDDAPERMIGDINLFLFPLEIEDDEQASSGNDRDVVGELEIMIARQDLQRQGYGRAALLMFLDYIIHHWESIASEYGQHVGRHRVKLVYLRVKINQTNASSIALFESLDFTPSASGVNYFGELELRWVPDLRTVQDNRSWSAAKSLLYGSQK